LGENKTSVVELDQIIADLSAEMVAPDMA